MQTVNNLHSRFETFMRPFCGPATKNLPAYPHSSPVIVRPK